MRNEKLSPEAAKFQAIGRRYSADGWSAEMPLFKFWSEGKADALLDAQDLRVRGTGGAARHRCEEITGVQYA